MLTIKTTGDDAWATDDRILCALEGYTIRLPKETGEKMWSIVGGDGGDLIVVEADINGAPISGAIPQRFDAHAIEIEVL